MHLYCRDGALEVYYSDISPRKAAEESLRKTLRRFELLAGAAGELLQSREPQRLVERLCRQVMEHLDCHTFFNFLVDEQADRLHLNACAGIAPEAARQIEWLDYGVAVCGCAARDGCRIVAEHIPTTPDPRTDLVKSYGIKAYACHPLLGPGGQVLGTLSFGTRSRETFSAEDLSLMKAITDHVAVAMMRMRGEAQLAQAYQRLDAHMEHSPLAAIEWGSDMRLIRWSREAERIFGWRADEVLGKQMTEFRWIYQEDAPQVAEVAKELQQGVQRFSANRNYRKDGTVIECHWYNSTLLDEQGRFHSILSLVQEVTEQNQTRRAMHEAQAAAERSARQAEAANKAKDQFIAVLSHELRTPLTPAVAALSMMQNDVRLPSDVREDLEMVNRNIALEVRLIADLLDVSRIISGKLHLEKRPVDVAVAIREAAAIVSGDLDAKGQTLTIETPGAPYLTFADAARLQQVFWNLLRNAIKFSPERGRITVRAHAGKVEYCPLAAESCPLGQGPCPQAADHNGDGNGDGNRLADGGNLTVQVIDSGIGISPEMRPRLFNAFEQDSKARSFGGLGLGLSICKAVVEMHGGTISAESDGAGKGSTLTVMLPIAHCQRPICTADLIDPSLKSDFSNAKLRILLVEDHADTAKLMRRLLMSQGHDVSTAATMTEGLAAVESGRPDVLISDLGLPDGSGLELMRQLLERGEHIPAIALSGYGTPADIESSKAAGFAEHLVKPLSGVDALTAALTRLGIGRGG